MHSFIAICFFHLYHDCIVSCHVHPSSSNMCLILLLFCIAKNYILCCKQKGTQSIGFYSLCVENNQMLLKHFFGSLESIMLHSIVVFVYAYHISPKSLTSSLLAEKNQREFLLLRPCAHIFTILPYHYLLTLVLSI